MAGLEIIFFLLRKWICVIPHTPLGSDSLLLIPPMVQSGSLTNLFPPMLQANPYSRLPKFFQPCLMVESMHSNYFIFCGIEYLNIRAYTSLAIDNNCYFESWGNGFASMALKIKAFRKKFLSKTRTSLKIKQYQPL